MSYDELKAYDGLYDYVDHSTLKIAASPRDLILYAIINESRYKLTPIGKDLFLNMSGSEVRFFRDSRNKIAGYKSGNDSFKLLDDKLVFPKEMWYPRIQSDQNASYVYKQPETIGDGITTGNVKDFGLNKALLDEMMKKIIDGQYPNVHSVLIMKHGKLVFEEYFYEYNRNKLHELRSATKSFVSGLQALLLIEIILKAKKRIFLIFSPSIQLAMT